MLLCKHREGQEALVAQAHPHLPAPEPHRAAHACQLGGLLAKTFGGGLNLFGLLRAEG